VEVEAVARVVDRILVESVMEVVVRIQMKVEAKAETATSLDLQKTQVLPARKALDPHPAIQDHLQAWLWISQLLSLTS
jgi:hypothetical protein